MIPESQQIFYSSPRTSCNLSFRFVFWGIASLCCLLNGLGCSGFKVSSGTKVQRAPLTTEQNKNFKPLQVNSVAVFPLRGEEQANAMPPTVHESLVSSFERKTSLEILNRTQAAKAGDELAKLENKAQALRQSAAEFGKALGAQGVLFGIVTHYNPSSGSKFGADSLASTGFRLWLIEPRTLQTLWTASYENSEQPLSENLFRLGEKVKTGVGFRDADELLKIGFESAAEELEKTRTRAPE